MSDETTQPTPTNPAQPGAVPTDPVTQTAILSGGNVGQPVQGIAGLPVGADPATAAGHEKAGMTETAPGAPAMGGVTGAAVQQVSDLHAAAKGVAARLDAAVATEANDIVTVLHDAVDGAIKALDDALKGVGGLI